MGGCIWAVKTTRFNLSGDCIQAPSAARMCVCVCMCVYVCVRACVRGKPEDKCTDSWGGFLNGAHRRPTGRNGFSVENRPPCDRAYVSLLAK